MPLDALALLKEIRSLLEEETVILASSEEASYFRKLYSQAAPISPPAAPVLQRMPPPPVAAPLPPAPEPTPAPPPAASIPEPSFVPTGPLPAPLVAPSLKSLFAKIAPDFPLLEQTPSDAIAKKIASRWKTKNQVAPISILSFNELPQQKALLEAIALAVDVYFGPAKIVNAEAIEKEKQWETFLSTAGLKLIVACDYTLWQLGSLLPFYREESRQLGKIPVFLLPDLALYLKDPLLKRSLWKALCQKLSM